MGQPVLGHLPQRREGALAGLRHPCSLPRAFGPPSTGDSSLGSGPSPSDPGNSSANGKVPAPSLTVQSLRSGDGSSLPDRKQPREGRLPLLLYPSVRESSLQAGSLREMGVGYRGVERGGRGRSVQEPGGSRPTDVSPNCFPDDKQQHSSRPLAFSNVPKHPVYVQRRPRTRLLQKARKWGLEGGSQGPRGGWLWSGWASPGKQTRWLVSP